MVVLLGGPRDRAHHLRRDHHRRLRRPQQGPRDQPLDGHPVRHGHRADVEAAAGRRLLDVRPHAPHDRRGAAGPHRPGLPARDEDRGREPPAARGARPDAARERGARARGHRAAGGQLPRAGGAGGRAASPRSARARRGHVAASKRSRKPERRLVAPRPGRSTAPAGPAVRILLGPCSGASTTSASPSRTSTRRSRSTASGSACRVQHRETVEEQGVDAVLLEVGDAPYRADRPLAPDTAVGSSSRGAAPACTTWPTGRTTSTPRSSPCERRACG